MKKKDEERSTMPRGHCAGKIFNKSNMNLNSTYLVNNMYLISLTFNYPASARSGRPASVDAFDGTVSTNLKPPFSSFNATNDKPLSFADRSLFLSVNHCFRGTRSGIDFRG